MGIWVQSPVSLVRRPPPHLPGSGSGPRKVREDGGQVRGDPAGQAVWTFLWGPGEGREDEEQLGGLGGLGGLEGLRGKVSR